LASFKTFIHPLFPKPVSWLGLFFAVSYSKLALGLVLDLSTQTLKIELTCTSLPCFN
jgi:hypothetical protein